MFNHAGFWRRFVAYIIDAVILGIVTHFIPPFLGLFLGWVYFTACESSPLQGTLGKKLLGLRVTDLNGERIGFGRASGRYFGKVISGVILGIGYLMIAFTENKQGLHDIMAGTLVLRRDDWE